VSVIPITGRHLSWLTSEDHTLRWSFLTSIACMEMRVYPIGGAWKRSLDCAAAFTGLLILSPIMLTTALLILIAMGRPIFSAQPTIGFSNSVFARLRFRTARPMHEGSSATNPPTTAFELWLGQTLRESGLDDLPQLLNILSGHMSFVGPQPVSAWEPVRGSGLKHYAKARPGLTGLRKMRPFPNAGSSRAACDCFYVRNWAPALDALIMSQTVLGSFSAGQRLRSGLRRHRSP
jgi:exopolysaccharide production protein ExoY